MTFMLSESVSRFIAVRYLDLSTLTVEPNATVAHDAAVEPGLFAGYESWLDSIDLDPTFPPATFMEPNEFAALIGEAPARPRSPFDQASRDARGAELAERAVICGACSVYFVQPSNASAEPYRVDLIADSCSCPDHINAVTRERENGNTGAACKHLVAVRLRAGEGRRAA